MVEIRNEYTIGLRDKEEVLVSSVLVLVLRIIRLRYEYRKVFLRSWVGVFFIVSWLDNVCVWRGRWISFVLLRLGFFICFWFCSRFRLVFVFLECSQFWQAVFFYCMLVLSCCIVVVAVCCIEVWSGKGIFRQLFFCCVSFYFEMGFIK